MVGPTVRFSKCGAFSYAWNKGSVKKESFFVKFGRSVKVFLYSICTKSRYVVSLSDAEQVYRNTPHNSQFGKEYSRQVAQIKVCEISHHSGDQDRITEPTSEGSEGDSVSVTPSQAGEIQQDVSEQGVGSIFVPDSAEIDRDADLGVSLPLLLQRLLPHKLISYIASVLAEIEWPVFKNWFIRFFIAKFEINMEDFVHESPKDYLSFNEFFTRPLKHGVRPLPLDGSLICSPVDGRISQIGEIKEGRIIQAKKHDYSLTALLGGDHELAEVFNNGLFSTIYLPPSVYHRVHMPVTGKLRRMAYVPGSLYSVNQKTVNGIDRLFARNERVVSVFDTEYGPMAVIMVGAMAVGSMETVWDSEIDIGTGDVSWSYYDEAAEPIILERGDEMGRFKMGSTVIVLFSQDAVRWSEQYSPGVKVRVGEALAAKSDEKERPPVQTLGTPKLLRR